MTDNYTPPTPETEEEEPSLGDQVRNFWESFQRVNTLGASDEEPMMYTNPETGVTQEVERTNLLTPIVGLNAKNLGIGIPALGKAALGGTKALAGKLGFSGLAGKLGLLGGGIAAGLGLNQTFNDGAGEAPQATPEMFTTDPYGNLPAMFREDPETYGQSIEQDVLDVLQNQEVGLTESYSNLYARAMQDAYRRRAATTSPFTGVGGGQAEQARQTLSAAEIAQLGQMGQDYNQMMMDIEGMRLAAPQQAREAVLQQFGIQQQQQDLAVQRAQFIADIVNSDLPTEQKVQQIRPYLTGTPEEIEAAINRMFEEQEASQGWINWNSVLTATGAGAIYGSSSLPGPGTVAGALIAGGLSIANQARQEYDWFDLWWENNREEQTQE